MTSNNRINFLTEIPTPDKILSELSLNKSEEHLINKTRKEIELVLQNKSNKIIVIVGPCSIHNIDSALEYAKFLKTQIDLYKGSLIIIMRTYFSKPRTVIGWKGFINDPDLDNSFNINKGLYKSRELLLNILKLGVPCAMEQLDTIIPQYFNDLLAWSAIGARTSESQVHRELASGISMPVGFKNNTEGNITVAIQGIKSCLQPHHFLGCNMEGKVSSIQTNGNPYGHIILRGSNTGPNYEKKFIKDVEEKLESNNLQKNIIIDFSHGNSNKDYTKQVNVAQDVCQQISNGCLSIKGCMIESNLEEGNQNINCKPLKYGVSITDSCINLETTKNILHMLHQSYLKRQTIILSDKI